MKKLTLLALPLILAPIACGPSTPPAEEPPPPPSASAAPPPPPVASAPVEAPKPPEPTPEEKAKAEAAKHLADDRAEWEAASKTEDARWTPEVHAEAKTLASTKYASLKAALGPILKGKHRPAAHVERDKARHPAETLQFWGLTPTMTVLEFGPGDGWYTELLAPTLAAKGKLFVTASDPNGPADQRSTFYGQRLKRFLDRAPEMFGGVERVMFDAKAPNLGMENKLDMVIMARSLHGMHRDKLFTGVLTEVFKALKPGGILAIEQHRAKADAKPEDSAKTGYLPEAWLVKELETIGFKLDAKSEVNANAKDTKDHPEGVWTLPPSLALKDKDKAKYVEIGESDRMTLRLVKPKAKGAAPKPKK